MTTLPLQRPLQFYSSVWLSIAILSEFQTTNLFEGFLAYDISANMLTLLSISHNLKYIYIYTHIYAYIYNIKYNSMTTMGKK